MTRNAFFNLDNSRTISPIYSKDSVESTKKPNQIKFCAKSWNNIVIDWDHLWSQALDEV